MAAILHFHFSSRDPLQTTGTPARSNQPPTHPCKPVINVHAVNDAINDVPSRPPLWQRRSMLLSIRPSDPPSSHANAYLYLHRKTLFIHIAIISPPINDHATNAAINDHAINEHASVSILTFSVATAINIAKNSPRYSSLAQTRTCTCTGKRFSRGRIRYNGAAMMYVNSNAWGLLSMACVVCRVGAPHGANGMPINCPPVLR